MLLSSLFKRGGLFLSLTIGPALAQNEQLAGLEEIRPPLVQENQTLLNATDSFGFEIHAQGFDLLFVTPDYGQAAHYSLQRGEFTNFFDVTSNGFTTSRYAYHYGPERIFRMNGSAFDIIDRISGARTRLTNLLGSPTATAQAGDLIVGMDEDAISAFDIASETIVYTQEPPQNTRWLAMRQHGNRIYALAAPRNNFNINDGRIACFDLTTGSVIFRRNVSVAILEHNPNPRLDVVPFAVDGGVVAIGSNDRITLLDADTGDERATHQLGQYVRNFVNAQGGVVGGYYRRNSSSGVPSDQICGAIAIGEDRIYLQNNGLPGSSIDYPGVSVFDFDFQHILDIPNPYQGTINDAPNDFGGTMVLANDRLIIGSGRYLQFAQFQQSQRDVDPRIHIASFTPRGGINIHPLTTNAYIPETELEVSENSALVFDVILNRAEEEDVTLRVRPNFGTTFDFPHPATAVDDFPTAFQEITFSPGETRKTLSFPIIDDDLVEENEQFNIVISRRTVNVTVPQPVVPVTIISDDFPADELTLMGELDTKVRYPGGTIGDVALGEDFIAVSVVNSNKILFYDATDYEFVGETEAGTTSGDDLGTVMDTDGQRLAAAAPDAASGEGRIVILDYSETTGASLLATVSPPVATGGTRTEFGRRVVLEGDILAVASYFAPTGGIREGQLQIYEKDSNDDSIWTLQQTLTAPAVATGNSTQRDIGFAQDFDIGGGKLVILHQNAEWVQSNPGESMIIQPDQSKIYIHDLTTIGTVERTITRQEELADISGEDLISAGPNDFVVIDGDSNRHVLVRYSYDGMQQAIDIQTADGQISEAFLTVSEYNGHISLRSVKNTRHLDAYFPADDSTADYPLGEPFIRYSSPISLSFVTRSGRDTRGSGRYIAVSNVNTRPSTPSANSLVTSMDLDRIVIAENNNATSSPAIYQLPGLAQAVSVIPTTINEGDTAATSRGNVTFRLSAAATNDVTIHFRTVSDTAKVLGIGSSTLGADVLTVTGTVTIPAGQLSATALIQLQADDKFEGDETFQVNIERVIGAGIRDRISTIVIVDDETEADLPAVSVGDTTWNEAANFTGQLSNGFSLMNDPEITFTLSETSDEDVVVEYIVDSSDAIFSKRLRQSSFESVAEPAVFGKDFTTPRYGRDSNGDFFFDLAEPRFAYGLVIPAGETTATVRIPVANDDVPELDETITVKITGVENARIDGSGTGTLTIIDDDRPSGGLQTTTIAPTGTTAQAFGADIDVDQKLVVGNQIGSVIIADLDGSNQITINAPETSWSFGGHVATEGNFVLAGDLPRSDRSFNGTAYLYDLSGNTLRTLTPTTPLGRSGARFGQDVAMASNGSTTVAVVAARSSEQAYVFDAATGAELQVFSITAAEKYATSVSADGSQVLVGTEGEGAYLYDWITGNQLHHFQPDDNGVRFGITGHIEGDYVFVGGDGHPTGEVGNNGVVTVYDRTTFSKLYDIEGTGNEFDFAKDIDLFGDKLAVRGNFGVYVFNVSDGSFLQLLGGSRGIAGMGNFLYTSDGSEITRYDFGSSTVQTGFGLWLAQNTIREVGGEVTFSDLRVPGLLAYALGLNDSSDATTIERTLPSIVRENAPMVRFQIPEQLPPDITLELVESQSLDGSDWQCIARRTGNRQWTIMRPSAFRPSPDTGLQQLEITNESATRSFYQLQVIQN